MPDSLFLGILIAIILCFGGVFAIAIGLIADKVKDKYEKTTAKKFSSTRSPWEEQEDFIVEEYLDYSEIIEQRQRL